MTQFTTAQATDYPKWTVVHVYTDAGTALDALTHGEPFPADPTGGLGAFVLREVEAECRRRFR